MKLGIVIPFLKKLHKIYESRVTPPMSYADVSIFSPVINKFCYVKKYRYRMHFDTLFLFLWTFYESLKIVLINMIKILMVSAKMAFLCFLKIRVFRNKIVSHVSNYIINVVMWPKFGKSIISMREVIKTSILLKFDLKNNFFEEWSWFKFNNLGVALGMVLKFYTSVAKGLKLKKRPIENL